MTIRRAILWGEYFLVAVGLLAIAYCTIVVGQATRYQAWARKHLGSGNFGTVEGATTRGSETISQQRPSLSSSGPTPIGRIDIPRIHMSIMAAEGTSPEVLQLAAGHMPGTALPGQAGNAVLAAHRDTFFRRLGELKPGDTIQLLVRDRQYVYSVEFTDVVSPSETWVLEPSAGRSLTLITCYPFYFVGSAPLRFVVRAQMMDSH